MMNNMLEEKTQFLEKIKFRRQFLLGTNSYQPNKHWQVQKLDHSLFLSVHEDLNFLSKKKNGYTITLIGIAIDCTDPSKTDNAIITTLLQSFSDIHSVIKASKPLAGRWVLICQNANNTFIFADPCGMRQVYFYTGKESWCASQPTLINQVQNLSETSNTDILTFKNSPDYKKRESAWIGNQTAFDNCLHLMPNHYLDLNSCSTKRFFPKKSLSTYDNIDELVADAATYLKNIINGLEQRYDLKVGLSAGFDSRLVLAGSVDTNKDILYITDDLGRFKSYHADLYVPKNLAEKFALNHTIIKHKDKFPSPWFNKILSTNVAEARVKPVLPKIKTIYTKLIDKDSEHISLNGNVTEIVRISNQKLKFEPIDGHYKYSENIDMAFNYAGYNNSYVKNRIISWMDSIDISLIQEATFIDMFYWEQRMGNWGALYPAELDIAHETVSPFNCRLLLETCLKVPRKQRIAPEFTFFREIISTLWAELLSEPINPGPKGLGLIKKVLREKLPLSLVKYLQKVSP
jgi:hypothetical protein